jgi:hypothetical protein
VGLFSKLLGREESSEESGEGASQQEQEMQPSSFEDVMKMMGQMTAEEMNAAMEEKSKICATMCGTCPSYEGTGEEKLLFCATGKSDVITEEKGCTCGGCAVQDQMMLRWDYYCMKGSGKDQAGM